MKPFGSTRVSRSAPYESSPRINQAGFVAVQQNTIVAILSAERLEECTRALSRTGVDVTRIDVLRGEDGLKILDVDGVEHGRWAHLIRSMQKLGTSSNERENYANAMRDGKAVLILPVSNDLTVRGYAKILDENGAQRIIHFTWYGAESLSY